MAFRALLSSKNADTNTSMVAACKNAGIRVEVCTDIFAAIEKGKTQPYSCLIADWAEQPEASFLLRRARESAPNRETLAMAIVDREPTAAEVRENRLAFLIHRPIVRDEALAVLAQACEQMRPSGDEDEKELQEDAAVVEVPTVPVAPVQIEQTENYGDENFSDSDASVADGGDIRINAEQKSPSHHYGRKAVAAMLLLATTFFLWRSQHAIVYLSHTSEGRLHVIQESLAAFLHNNSGATPVAPAVVAPQQETYATDAPASASTQTLTIGVVPAEASLADTRMALPKAQDFPLPTPTVLRQEPPPFHHERAAIPDSMKTSLPIAPPIVVTVNAAQMMPISIAQPPPPPMQQLHEPITVTEETERALLLKIVNPTYPPQALAQKLHGPVVLQALIARDGTVADLKIVRGYFILGQAAIAAVKQWRFEPYVAGGHAAATQTTITVNFSFPPS